MFQPCARAVSTAHGVSIQICWLSVNSLVISVAKHLQQNVSEHLQLVHAHTKKQDECIAGLKRKIGDASASKNGTLIWRISNVSQKVNCKDLELVSRPFYTSLVGYKLHASLFLTGNGAGEKTHLSLYIKILPGQYDSVLSWPFIHSISFTVLDQNTSGQVVKSLKHSFQMQIGQILTVPLK